MAEVKNAFIGSKMNQDLDDRLVPSGEYREGFNIQVSKSQGADVGALENILGNELIKDFEALTVSGIQVIGQFTNPAKNTIYLFLTDYENKKFATEPKYNPSAQNFIYEYNVLNGRAIKLAEGAFLNFSTTNPILGVNMLEDILFFTDNRNQPRRIDVTRRSDAGGVYYTNEDLVSVAQYNPYQPIELYKVSLVAAAAGAYESTMYDVVNEFLPDGTTSNPYYNPNYAGDPDYLEDKFVRFTYRFRFNGGEYSVLAPFTQALFIPQQDGYFLPGDEESAYRSTIVQFMQNKVNQILLQIPIPANNGTQFVSNFNINEIEVIFKESDSQALYVVDVIPAETIEKSTTRYIEYDYQAKKPFKTLPESTLIRVYDKIPVKALSQEIIGNRVVYGNYQDKHTPPTVLNYDVGISPKSNFDIQNAFPPENTTSIVEYPNHTLKQNRNYQVGVVLSDRYGRSSTTILSTITSGEVESNVLYGASTVYNPYRIGTLGNNSPFSRPVAEWPGDSLKIRFDSSIKSSKNPVTKEPGLYNGNPNSTNYNPLGWYSYKIVVKQLEQEYYNVYLGGILNGYPGAPASPADPQNTTAFVTLINDNINKVPRDLVEVGPDQKQYRSSVQLFGRVTPNRSTAPTYNQQYYPGQVNSITPTTATTKLPSSDTVNTIGEETNIIPTVSTYVDIYQTDSNPYLARIVQGNTNNPIGSLPIASGSYNFLLGIYETEPVVSRLEIFWETSTAGLISELNEAITTGTNEVAGLFGFTWSLTEASAIGNSIAGRFAPIDEAGENETPQEPLVTSDLGMSVTDINGNTISKFSLIKIPGSGTYNPLNPSTYDTYEIKTTDYFYYGPGAAINEVYYFTFFEKTENNKVVANLIQSLGNVAPTITNGTSVNLNPTVSNPVFTYTAVNGTASPTLNSENLTWSIAGNPPEMSIEPTTGNLNVSEELFGKYTLTITVQDAGGLTNTITSNVVFGEVPINNGFGSRQNYSLSTGSGDSGAVYWVDDNTNALTSTPLPGSASGTVDIRAPYSGLVLSTTSSNVSLSAPDCTGWTFKNSNIESAGAYNGTGGLSQGTAFIALELQLDQFSWNNGAYINTFPFVMYPIYLQFRDPSGVGYPNNWVSAVDIEGNEIKFGGTQGNDYAVTTDPNGDIDTSGVITDDAAAADFSTVDVNTSPSTINIDNNDCLESILKPKGTFAANSLTTIARKVFVIGKSQQKLYTSAVSKYGDYRLIARYPWGLDTDNPGVGGDIVLGYGTGLCPVTSAYKFETENKIISLKLTYGDFYYPSTYGSENVFQYQVSSTNSQNAIEATKLPATTSVYAREWAYRYVTKFYTDVELTQPWTPPASSGWYSYRAVDNNSINAKYGNDFSFPRGATNLPGGQLDVNRKWAAYFNSDGLKTMGDVQPAISPSGIGA
jgi:hypothetical protein